MKQTKTPSKPAVSQAKTSAPATYDWGGQTVTGFERTSTEDLGIPFLVILQKGSPEVDKTHKDYATKCIKDAGVGDIINTVSRKVIYKSDDEPVIFIPCAYEKLFVEWKPRDEGGGFVRSHNNPAIINECTRNEKNQDVLPNGNLVQTTAYFFGLVLNAQTDEWERAVIGMTSTQLKKSRAWLNMMMSIKIESPTKGMITPPMFSHRYALSTQPESNDQGGWYGWKIENAGLITEPDLVTKCVGIAQNIMSGKRPQIGAPAATETADNPPM